MASWWENYELGRAHQVVLIQFDLGGHSRWAKNNVDYSLEVAKDRAEFAAILKLRLAHEGFDALYWLGDGGVFAQSCEPTVPDRAVEAVDIAFQYFDRFRTTFSYARDLSLRATATTIEVYLSPNASDWFSVELNEFLKYERTLGLTNAFVITNPLFRRLNRCKERFSNPRSVLLQDGATDKIVYVHTDSLHSFKATTSGRSFKVWLAKNKDVLPKPSLINGADYPELLTCENTAILDTAVSREGYYRVQLEREESFPQSAFEASVEPYAELWRDSLAKSAAFEGTKATVLGVTVPVSDDPTLYLDIATLDFKAVRAFHEFVENDGVRKLLLRDALKVQSRRSLPTSLTVDVAVLLGQGDNRQLLICHRALRKGGFTRAVQHWSASFEEQFGRSRAPGATLYTKPIRV